MQESILSTSTAELLAEHIDVDCDLAFSCAIFRPNWEFTYCLELSSHIQKSKRNGRIR